MKTVHGYNVSLLKWVEKGHPSWIMPCKFVDDFIIVNWNVFVNKEQQKGIEPFLAHGAPKGFFH